MIWDPRELKPIISTLITGEPSHWDTPLGFFQRHTDIFYDRPRDPDRNPLHRDFVRGTTAHRMLSFHKDVAEIPYEDWNMVKIQKTLDALKWELNGRPIEAWQDDGRTAQKSLYQYLRWALYGARPGPDLASIMYYLGRDKTLGRLQSAERNLSEAIEVHKN